MKQIYLLPQSTNWSEFEYTEKRNFLKTILENINVSYEDCFDNNLPQNRAKLNSILLKYNISIVDEENYSIYVDNELIAKMDKPFYKLKKDINSLNRNNIYLEAEINFWSIFEDNK